RQQLMADVGALVSEHQQLATSYANDLQAEYAFYVRAAQTPAVATAVLGAATAAGQRQSNAVSTDLSAVQTQLAQEAVIRAAANKAPPVALSQTLTATVTLQAPLAGVETQLFGPSVLAMEPPIDYGGVFYPHFHTGVDIAAPLDTPVGAAAGGVVVFGGSSLNATGQLVGYGNYVVIRHATGALTLYAHLDRIEATVGETVQQGQVIGLCGTTGNSTGPHVHFEVRINGVPVDPAPYLGSQLSTS
ncbi:MAG: M23 family metallopeptidase, partial [Candidatus Dormibacteraeota bacterium]|nr:M23 family metallopeptidase [Candidatus Dormibacteraeota bacterium]